MNLTITQLRALAVLRLGNLTRIRGGWCSPAGDRIRSRTIASLAQRGLVRLGSGNGNRHCPSNRPRVASIADAGRDTLQSFSFLTA